MPCYGLCTTWALAGKGTPGSLHYSVRNAALIGANQPFMAGQKHETGEKTMTL